MKPSGTKRIPQKRAEIFQIHGWARIMVQVLTLIDYARRKAAPRNIRVHIFHPQKYHSISHRFNLNAFAVVSVSC